MPKKGVMLTIREGEKDEDIQGIKNGLFPYNGYLYYIVGTKLDPDDDESIYYFIYKYGGGSEATLVSYYHNLRGTPSVSIYQGVIFIASQYPNDTFHLLRYDIEGDNWHHTEWYRGEEHAQDLTHVAYNNRVYYCYRGGTYTVNELYVFTSDLYGGNRTTPEIIYEGCYGWQHIMAYDNHIYYFGTNNYYWRAEFEEEDEYKLFIIKADLNNNRLNYYMSEELEYYSDSANFMVYKDHIYLANVKGKEDKEKEGVWNVHWCAYKFDLNLNLLKYNDILMWEDTYPSFFRGQGITVHNDHLYGVHKMRQSESRVEEDWWGRDLIYNKVHIDDFNVIEGGILAGEKDETYAKWFPDCISAFGNFYAFSTWEDASGDYHKAYIWAPEPLPELFGVYAKIDEEWRFGQALVKVDGSWRDVSQGWVKEGGSWKPIVP